MLCISYLFFCLLFFFFKQKTAYEMRISDWSSDVCSSDLDHRDEARTRHTQALDRLGIDGRGDHGLALALFRRGQEEAPFVDVAYEVLLVPQRIAAVDLRHRPHAPRLARHPRHPFQRAGIPAVASPAGLPSPPPPPVPDDHAAPAREH